MPNEHANLSPSAAERWLTCTASVALAAEVGVDISSPYAEEGTDAHTMAEAWLRLRLLDADNLTEVSELAKSMIAKYGDARHKEMTKHVRGLEDFIRERLALYTSAWLFLEQRMDTGIEGCWGTSDVVVVAPTERVIEITDLKYGAGIAVSAEDNPQLKLYALGAYETFSMLGEFDRIVINVFQPRAYRGDLPHTWEITTEALLSWRESIRPAAAAALAGEGEFKPSEDACRWCPAAGRCEAQSEYLLGVARNEFAEPIHGTLSPERIAEILSHADMIRSWLDAVASRAFDLAYGGTTVPGYKVVRRGGRRYVADPAGLIDALSSEGYGADDVLNSKIKSFTDLEALVGSREGFDRIATPYVAVSEPKLALAEGLPEDDDAVTSATEIANEFGEPL